MIQPVTIDRSDKPLSLDHGWCIGETAFGEIVEKIKQLEHITRLVEFGSGASSVRLALEFPQIQILSIDGDWESFVQINELAEAFDVKATLKLSYRPIWFQAYGPCHILSYEKRAMFDNQTIDCAIIDGPPFYTLRGREACLYQIYDQLRVGGLVVLDDFRRVGEKQILSNWLSVYPGSFAVEVVQKDHHLVALRKTKDVSPMWHHPTRMRDWEHVHWHYVLLASALRHIDDDFLAKLKKRMKHTENLEPFFHILRNAYQVEPKEIEFKAAERDPKMRDQQNRLKLKYYKRLYRILFEGQDGERMARDQN